MRSLGPSEADIRVYTFKEGLLSPVAHDLQLRATRFEIIVDATAPSVRARVEPGSLEVVCAMKGGQEAEGALSSANKAEIQQNIQRDVLHTARFASALFESSALTETEVVGRLTLHGVTREVRVPWRTDGESRVGELRIDQRDYGIKPYTALFGALKVQAEVLVVVRVRWTEA